MYKTKYFICNYYFGELISLIDSSIIPNYDKISNWDRYL